MLKSFQNTIEPIFASFKDEHICLDPIKSLTKRIKFHQFKVLNGTELAVSILLWSSILLNLYLNCSSHYLNWFVRNDRELVD